MMPVKRYSVVTFYGQLFLIIKGNKFVPSKHGANMCQADGGENEDRRCTSRVIAERVRTGEYNRRLNVPLFQRERKLVW